MPDEVLHNIQEKQNKYIEKLKISIPKELDDPDFYVDCSDKDDMARYILDMISIAMGDAMFMAFDAFNEAGLLKREV